MRSFLVTAVAEASHRAERSTVEGLGSNSYQREGDVVDQVGGGVSEASCPNTRHEARLVKPNEHLPRNRASATLSNPHEVGGRGRI
jgi:hypothetical protein